MKDQILHFVLFLSFFAPFSETEAQVNVHPDARYAEAKELQVKANGFKGIWYMNQPSDDEYVYKYSGGMAVYSAKHRPFAIYSKEANKTFFCFGGTDDSNSTLFHNVSYFDHATGKVANPTIILDKKTNDAHDNPVISMDDKGYVWIFSTSHGTNRPSYIYKSCNPYSINKFEKIHATEILDGVEKPFDNFSYFQVWHVKDHGFMALFTKYNGWNNRIIGFNTSKDGVKWKEWKVIAHIEEGHYQISGEYNGKISLAFDYHPLKEGLNYRTNLYYLETNDFGETWQIASGEKVQLPLTTVVNPALVRDYKSEGLLCYIKDISFDEKGNPIVLVISSKGFQCGHQNNPRTWEVFSYNNKWHDYKVTTSNNNYDTGSLYIEPNGAWRIIGPTEMGPQQYNPGGEIAVWLSADKGVSWQMVKQLTSNSLQNNNFVRRPVNAQPGFYGIWADGNGRKPSESYLYFCDKDGNIFKLPRETTDTMVSPVKMSSIK